MPQPHFFLYVILGDNQTLFFHRYACLVAEEAEPASQLSQAPYERIIGVVDCTVQDEDGILKHLQGADEYLYVSGIAVLPSFRYPITFTLLSFHSSTCPLAPRVQDPNIPDSGISSLHAHILFHACRRRKVGTALLKACEALGFQWKHRFMVLRAYEDDDGARGLYAKAGYRVVSRDPDWVTWVGRRRRVLMIKELPVHDDMIQQQ